MYQGYDWEVIADAMEEVQEWLEYEQDMLTNPWS
jgi:hypothetical protein